MHHHSWKTHDRDTWYYLASQQSHPVDSQCCVLALLWGHKICHNLYDSPKKSIVDVFKIDHDIKSLNCPPLVHVHAIFNEEEVYLFSLLYMMECSSSRLQPSPKLPLGLSLIVFCGNQPRRWSCRKQDRSKQRLLRWFMHWLIRLRKHVPPERLLGIQWAHVEPFNVHWNLTV